MRSAAIVGTPRQPSPRWRWRATLAVLLVGAVSASTAAEALAAPPIRPPRIRLAPPVELRLPPTTQRELAGAAGSAAKYGDEAAAVETQLDGLRSDAAGQVDADVAAVGRTAEARAAVRACVSDGLQSTADDYGQALADYAATGTHDFPGVYASVSSAAYGCIQSQTGAPSEVVEPATEYLAGHLHEQFATVANTTRSGPAQHRWLELLASDVAASGDASPEPPSESISSDEPGGSPESTSSDDPPAALIAGVAAGLALLTLVGVIALRSRRTT